MIKSTPKSVCIIKVIMGITIKADYASDAHYWEKYPALFEGKYPIKESILNHEINKYSLCDNSYAYEKYGWSPKFSMEDGLKELIKAECKLLDSLEEK